MIPFGFIAVFCLAADPSASLDWLLDRNEEALGRLPYSFRAKVESRGSLDGGDTWRPMGTLRLDRSGSRERYRMAVEALPGKGAWEDNSGFQTGVFTPEGTWGLSGMDPDHPPRDSVAFLDHETTGKGSKVTGRISAAQPRGPHGYGDDPAPAALGWVVNPHHTLREMSRFSARVAPTEGRDDQGDPTWILQLRDQTGKWKYVVHLNPKYNYMISKIRITGAYSIDWQAEEFQEPAPGVFVAKVARRTIWRPELKTALSEN